MKAIFKIFLVIILGYGSVHAQVSFPTPNATELGKYGQVPVELFNGLPQIGVPIHVVKNRDIEVPIQLSYYASGIKTEQHPTWAGLGWNLSCGGSITRIINGRRDDLRNTDIVNEGASVLYTRVGFGNFWASQLSSGSDWSQLSGFSKFFPGSSIDEKMYLDGEPDEFMINAPGISASFYFYRDALDNLKVKVKSKDGEHLSVEPIFSGGLTVNFAQYDPNPSNWPLHSSELQQSLLNSFYKFTVISEDGKKYTFGGDFNAIDFYTLNINNTRNTQPSTWYLTEIESIPGTKVNFSYKREGNPIVANSVTSKIFSYLPNTSTGSCLAGCPDSYDGLFYTIQHPVYLSSVTGSDGTNIQFTTNRALDLPYDVDDNIFTMMFDPTFPINHNAVQTMLSQNFWVKLYQININNKRKITFNYTENTSQRLRLSSVVFSDNANNQLNKYGFAYNTKLLPRYNVRKSDNWGYYNDKAYHGVNFDDLYTFRSPDTALMKSEVLTSISYPTGGVTNFEYESHSYSKIATQFPLFQLQTSSGIAGGLRIKRITSKDGASVNPSIIKDYTYLNEDNTSSGILSGIPIYHATGRSQVSYTVSNWEGLAGWRASANYVQKYDVLSENYINMLGNTNGNHVTYSRVVESTSGNGKIVSKYRNHDLFPDSLPVRLYTNIDDRTLIDKFTSKEIERGLLISTEVFDNNNNPVESTDYEYNSSPGRYNEFIRSVSKDVLAGPGIVSFIRMSANKIYTFYPYLSKKTTKTFGLAGQAGTTTVQNFTYTVPENLLKDEVLINSKGQTVTTNYKYPGNMLAADPVYQEMYNKHIYSPVIEKTITYPGNKTEYERTDYFQPTSGIYVRRSVYSGPTKLTAEPRFWYHYYDVNGNVLSTAREKGATTSYIWGYKKQYPISETKNGDKTEVYQQNFEEPELGLDFEANVVNDNTRPHTGKYSGRIINPNATEFVSHSDKGITISLSVPKKFTYSGWVYSNGPSAQIHLFMFKAGETAYFTYVDAVQTTVTNKWVYVKKEFLVPADVVYMKLRIDNNAVGTVWFDDLRIQPSDASMNTYTYEPLVGITSAIDDSGKTVYYEYDTFQRLMHVKDQNGDIIKKYDYHYKP